MHQLLPLCTKADIVLSSTPLSFELSIPLLPWGLLPLGPPVARSATSHRKLGVPLST